MSHPATHPEMDPRLAPPFPKAALPVLRNIQLRKNVEHATDVIQTKRNRLVAEKTDWQQLRNAASAIRAHALDHLLTYLEQFESRCTAAGGIVHWAADAAEARTIILNILRDSHIVVPALHVGRSQVREIFARRMGLKDLSDDPHALAAAARTYLRQKFLSVPTAISGANFLIADTGGVAIVESEGNGRMCLTLPRTIITIAGIEKVIPRFQDLEVMLQVLARSATGERMNPYTSLWTGVRPGDGPQRFHVVLLDNGRSSILARHKERQTLKCIRCAACINTCPVYRQTGGHAYGSVYPGPIGAILTPQLMNMEFAQSLPYASSLCGACYEVCPVKINIPEVLIELRAQVVNQEREEPNRFFDPMYLGMHIANGIFASASRFRAAQRMGRIALKPFTGKDGWIRSLPGLGSRWTMTRDLRGLPDQTFREWWATRGKEGQ